MYDIQSLGRRIMVQREALELTREYLAEICDISSKSIFRIEYGLSMPRIDTLSIICLALNMNIGILSEFCIERGETRDE